MFRPGDNQLLRAQGQQNLIASIPIAAHLLGRVARRVDQRVGYRPALIPHGS